MQHAGFFFFLILPLFDFTGLGNVSITPERNVSSIFLSLTAQIPFAYEVETSSAEPKPRLHTPGTADVLLKTVRGSATERCGW